MDIKIQIKNIKDVLKYKNCKNCGKELNKQWKCKKCKLQLLFEVK